MTDGRRGMTRSPLDDQEQETSTMTTAQTPEQMLREFHETKAIHGGLMPEHPAA